MLNPVYAKNILWQNLRYLSSLHNLPWLVARDFNDIASHTEKFGGRQASMTKCLNFSNNLANCKLLDIGFHGTPYTWSNHRYSNKHTLIRERLDCFLCNDNWLSLFPNSQVFHLMSPASDHCPIILKTSYCPPSKSPFRFQSMWLHDPTFPKLVDLSWNRTNDYQINLNHFLSSVKIWNKEYFGNIFYRKKKILARIHGIRNFLDHNYSTYLTNLLQDLSIEYFKILRGEEEFWKLKSIIL